jgi:methionine-R-sulfoxide reductase
MKILLLIFASLSLVTASCQSDKTSNPSTTLKQNTMPDQKNNDFNKTEEEWKKTLSEEQYQVLREKGTERPFTGKYNMHFEKGVYKCAACGYELFTSDQKFESHCGWPSFDSEIGSGDRIKKVKDFTHGMIRTEIVCARCGGHLGHIFDDGPTKTGQRYCVNSVSIDFEPAKDEKK